MLRRWTKKLSGAVAECIAAEVDTVLAAAAPGDLAVAESSAAQCACSSPLPGGKLTIKGKTVSIPGLPLIFEQCAERAIAANDDDGAALLAVVKIYHGVAPEEEAEYRSALVGAYQEFRSGNKPTK